MKPLILGLAILALGGWAVTQLQAPRSSSGRGLTGTFSGYASAPSPAVSATKGVAAGILKP